MAKKKDDNSLIKTVYTPEVVPSRKYFIGAYHIHKPLREIFSPRAIRTKGIYGPPERGTFGDIKVVRYEIKFPTGWAVQEDLPFEKSLIPQPKYDDSEDTTWYDQLLKGLDAFSFKVFIATVNLVYQSFRDRWGWVNLNDYCELFGYQKEPGRNKYHWSKKKRIKETLEYLGKPVFKATIQFDKYTPQPTGKRGKPKYEIEPVTRKILSPLIQITDEFEDHTGTSLRGKITGRGFGIAIPPAIVEQIILGKCAYYDHRAFTLDDKVFVFYTYLADYYRSLRAPRYNVKRGDVINRNLWELLDYCGFLPLTATQESRDIEYFHSYIDALLNAQLIEHWYIADKMGGIVSRNWHKERRFSRWEDQKKSLGEYFYYFKMPGELWDKIHQIKQNGQEVIDIEAEDITETPGAEPPPTVKT